MQETRLLFLTGETGTGKTMILKKLLPELDSSGVRIGGILAPGRYLGSGEKEFDLELVSDKKRIHLSSRKKHPGWQAIGSFWFNPQAIKAGLRHLDSLHTKQYHLYLLDEIGPLELDGLLWAPAIPALLNEKIPMIWTVRNRIIEQVCTKWNLACPGIITLTEGAWEQSMAEIRIWLKKNIQELY